MGVGYAIAFDACNAGDVGLVGGKGANLGKLTAGGFLVPPGFTVSTEAYQRFLSENSLHGQIAELVGSMNFAAGPTVDDAAAKIRELIGRAPFPEAVISDIEAGYRGIGIGQRVAVRSSGTAEDLEDTSFAGQHDSYLHIRGLDNVLDAVKRCWASLWASRAVTYRQHKGMGHEAGIAVVVQRMVDAEVAGVMFTANPLTAITDEIGINASWGLGEAVVSGLVTPDAYILELRTLRVKEKALGAKEMRVRLDDDAGQGTIAESVPQPERDVFALSDAQVTELGDLGRRVMAHYGGFPQDIEWALSGGKFYLLQARPITGVDFSWDELVDDWSTWNAETVPDDTVWSRVSADDGWTGAVTPLFYSIRGEAANVGHRFSHSLYGFRDLAAMPQRRYYRGGLYGNTRVDGEFVARIAPPALRPLLLAYTSPFDRDRVLNAPYSYARLAYILARIHLLAPRQGVTRWMKVLEDYVDNRRVEAAGKTDEELRLLSDEELLDYTEDRVDYERTYIKDAGYIGAMLYITMASKLLEHLVAAWYDGDKPGLFIDLVTGTNAQTFSVREALELWHLAGEIRSSDQLKSLFDTHSGADFFAELPKSAAGRAFLTRYQAFARDYAYRGHSDRDIYFPRRAEDGAAIDYRLLSAFLSVDASHDPAAIEEAALHKKAAAFEEMVTNLRKQRHGFLKVRIFKLLNAYNQRWLIIRDDQRGFIDISTFTYKRCFRELNRRLMERGVFDEDRDFYFLSRSELYEVARGQADMALAKAKIAGRKKNFDLVHAKQVQNPLYLQFNRPVQLGAEAGDGINFKGVPTSGGVITGPARLVKSLEEIGRVRQGDIMVCNSTDPGWTPVFLMIAGAVFETGGVYAHCSLLAREYGIPAVQLPGALQKIPDGATIAIDGHAGTVTIVEVPAAVA
jgi:rifampicin phosphotransferase